MLIHTFTQLFVTPWTVAHQATLSMGFTRLEYWSGSPCPPPGYLPNPGIQPRSATLRAVSLPSEPPGKLHVTSLSSFKYVLGWKQASWLQGCRIPWEVLWRGSFRLRVSLGFPGDARLFQLTCLHFSTPKVCVLVTKERKQVGISLIMLVCHIFLPLSFEN